MEGLLVKVVSYLPRSSPPLRCLHTWFSAIPSWNRAMPQGAPNLSCHVRSTRKIRESIKARSQVPAYTCCTVLLLLLLRPLLRTTEKSDSSAESLAARL